ncbi:hypothetical protein TrST_g2301 [Triparma strigata]|uniref:Major facilitator superfamily (MFS) profile domain-containing protein n=1 Tax=Triparma strigata TaxID=1606541 RepID=A0A9W7E8D0_9STRA|nr:hypothetical protein TrST_g2301 [Triparma strigata]
MSIDTGEGDTSNLLKEDKEPKLWVVKLLFCVLFLLEMLLNFDSGGTPAVLEFLTVDFRLSPGQQGLLGALPYIGTLFMSPFAGQLLSRDNPKICVCVSLVLNTFFCAMFAFSPVCVNPEGNCAGSYILLGCKLAIGISQACILIYLPVWVDEFAIPSLRTLWMSLLQAGVPLGVMLGYLFSGYLAEQGKMNPPYCHKEVESEFNDCCGLGGDCEGTKWGEIEQCCGVSEVACGDTTWNLEQCCKPFNCPGGCWYCKWKYAIFLQVCLLAPLCLACIFVPKRYFITNKSSLLSQKEIEKQAAAKAKKEGKADRGTPINSEIDSERQRIDSLWDYIEGGKDASNIPIWKQVRILWRSRVLVWTSLGLSALYFVVAGIQFWVTQYLVEVIGVPYSEALGAFTVVSATGPVFGVVFGGWLVDYLGGYKGKQGVARTTKIIITFGLLALLVAFPAAFVMSVNALMPLIWLLLFFGGAIVPAAVGICLSAVPPSIRPFSSSVSMVVYNILGHSAGTLLPGIVMDIRAKAEGCKITKSEASESLEPCAKEIMTLGMRIVLLWAFSALFTFGKSAWKAHKSWTKAKEAGSEMSSAAAVTPQPAASPKRGAVPGALPPRTEWTKLTKEEIDSMANTINDEIYDVDVDDVEEEMKRRATYMPTGGLMNGAHTEFGEIFPKLKKAQENFEGKVTNVADKIRRVKK